MQGTQQANMDVGSIERAAHALRAVAADVGVGHPDWLRYSSWASSLEQDANRAATRVPTGRFVRDLEQEALHRALDGLAAALEVLPEESEWTLPFRDITTVLRAQPRP